MNVSKEQMQHMYQTMMRIRKFELNAQNDFANGKIVGFLHLYLRESEEGRLYYEYTQRSWSYHRQGR